MNLMNKLSEVTSGSLLADLNYFKKLQSAQKLLEKEVLSEFRVNSELLESSVLSNKKFSSHPKRICSDTDTSISISPRRYKVSSDVNVAIRPFYEDKNQVKNERKKKHKFLTQTRRCFSSQLELGIGDSLLVTHKIKEKTEVKQDEDMLPNRRASSSKPSLENTAQKIVLTDAAFEKKFKLTIEKSLHTMNDINSLMEKGIDPPDGDEDMSRRKLRVKEFSNRFSRNYLYPIARQIEDLNKIKSPSTRNPNQKLLSAYTVVLHGLQAYHNHLPSSIGDCSADKLRSLLKHFLELSEIHSRMLKESDEDKYMPFIDGIKANAEVTIRKTEDYMMAISTESMLKPVATKISLIQKKKKSKPKTNIAERLAMYAMPSSFRKDPMWRKTAESLAYKKPVKSRYKTATFRHRPPTEKDPLLALSSKCSYFPSKTSIKKTPVTTPVGEDEIETMVQIEDDKNKNSTDENRNEVEVNHEELLVKLLQLVLDNNQLKENSHGNAADNAADNEVKIGDVLEKLKKNVDPETLRKVVEEMKKKEENKGQQLELKISDSCTTVLTDGTVKKRKEPKITVTGPKNAKLICIKDDNSVIYSDEEKEKDDGDTSKHSQAEKCIPLKAAVSSSHTQTLDNQTMKNKSTQRPPTQMNIKKLHKSAMCLQMLPKYYALNIIQYKLEFHKYCKAIPMYRRTTNILPWMLMGKISDEILNFAVLGVAREIEVNDIAERIYQSELQL